MRAEDVNKAANTTPPGFGQAFGQAFVGGGEIGYEPVRPSFRESLDKLKYHALEQSRKAEKLIELTDLLDKHPDVARILDLIEEVGL